MMDKYTIPYISVVGQLTDEQKENVRRSVANYGLAAVMDSAVRTEAETICEKK